MTDVVVLVFSRHVNVGKWKRGLRKAAIDLVMPLPLSCSYVLH